MTVKLSKSDKLPFAFCMAGDSDSSESLDSDHDETFETNDDELSPAKISVQPVSPVISEHQGGRNVQQEMVRATEDEFVVSKDTEEIPSRPLSLNRYGDVTMKNGDGVIPPKKPPRYTQGDEGTIKNTEKTRSRPGSLSLDEDMSYVAAPRFNIPSKRRQSSNSEDPTQKSGDRFEKRRSRSEENLLKNGGRLNEDEPTGDVMIECKNTRSQVQDQDENISDILEDVFKAGEAYHKDDGIVMEYENRFNSTPEDFESDERGIVDESLPQGRSQNFNMNELIGDDEGLSSDEQNLHKETEIAVESSRDLDEVYEAHNEQSDIKTDQESEVSTTDEIKIEDKAFASDIPRNVDDKGDNYPGNAVSQSDDNESTEKLSVLSRIKNWEHKSIEDRFGTSVVRPRPIIDIGVKKEDKQIYDDQRKASEDEYESSSESSGSEKNFAEPVSVEIEETQERRNPSSISMEDRTSADVNETSLRMDLELQQELNENPDVSSDNITPSHVIENDIPSVEDVDEISTNMKEEDEMELQQDSNTDKRLNNVSQTEAMGEDFLPQSSTVEISANLEETEMESGDSKHSKNVIQNETIPYDLPSEDDTVEASTNLKDTEMAPQLESTDDEQSEDVISEAIQSDLIPDASAVETPIDLVEAENEFQQESNDDKDSDNVEEGEPTQNDFSPEDCTIGLSMNLEESEMKLQRESSDDKGSNNVNQGEAMENDLPSKDNVTKHKSEIKPKLEFISSNNDSSFKTGVNFTTSSSLKSDTFVDIEVPSTPTNYEEEKTGVNPFDSEDDTPKSDEEREAPRHDEVHAEISTGKDIFPEEPYSHETNVVQPASQEEPASPLSRVNAIQAFSETFVSTNLGLKRHESREDRDTHEDRGYLEDQVTREGYEYQHTTEERAHDEDTRVDRGYPAGQDTREERKYDEEHAGNAGEEPSTRGDRDYHEESEGPDSRRSSDFHYEGFHGDNESMISETSGYGTPTASEDTSSKRTPSISGDEGTNAPGEARRPPSVSTKVNCLIFVSGTTPPPMLSIPCAFPQCSPCKEIIEENRQSYSQKCYACVLGL